MQLFRNIRHTIWMMVNLAAAIALLLADLAVWVPPSVVPLCSVLAVGFEWLLVLNILLALTWLLTHRKRFALLGMVAVLLSMGGVLRTVSHGRPSPQAEGRELTVLTYNTHMCQLLRKAPKNDVLRYIRESDADVVCLQEYEVRRDSYYLTFQEAKRYLADRYPYTYFDFAIHNRRRQYGTAVYSKYPLEGKHTVPYESRGNISSCCDVVLGDDTIRLITNHLESNSFTRDELATEDMWSERDGLETERLKEKGRGVLRKMKSAYLKREQEARAVRCEIDQSPYPVLVVGDFNDVPTSYTYHTIRGRDLQDAFLTTSWGQLGHSFVHRGLGLRIDYVLTSSSLRAVSYRVDKVDYSDHYPVLVTLRY